MFGLALSFKKSGQDLDCKIWQSAHLCFADIQGVKNWLFNKSDDVSFMYRWFIYVTMKQSIAPRQGHFLIFVIFAIRSVLITAVHWPSLGKFILGLSEILFMTQHTSRYINTIVCACQVLVQWKGFCFAHYLWNTRYHWFVVFPIATTKCTVAPRSWLTFDRLSRLA